MKCNTKNRPLTPEQEERQRKNNIRNNEQYLNYISRCLMLSVRNNAGFGAVRLKRFNSGAYDISSEYIREYGMAKGQADYEYARDSYYAMRRDLQYIGWEPEAELWQTDPFDWRDFPTPGWGIPASERRKREDYLYYANQLSFYVRELLCGAALELHHTSGFGADRISRVMHPCRDRWLGLMRIYFTMDRVAVEKEMRAMLQEFNECGVFEKEVLL